MTKKSIKRYRILRKRSRRREKAMIKTCALVMAFLLLWNDSNFKDLEDLRGIAFRYHSVEYDPQMIALIIFGAVFDIGVDNET